MDRAAGAYTGSPGSLVSGNSISLGLLKHYVRMGRSIWIAEELLTLGRNVGFLNGGHS
jgi:hypothetical protein